MPETEKENFALKAERYFKKNNTLISAMLIN